MNIQEGKTLLKKSNLQTLNNEGKKKIYEHNYYYLQMRYPPQEIKIRTLIAYQLPQLILGLNYALPLILPFKQFALCNILFSFIQYSKFAPRIFHQFQLYLYAFIISLALLFQNSYYKTFLLGVCFGLLSNVTQEISKHVLLFECQFKYIGMLNYYIFISSYPMQYASIYTFAIISICRFLLFDDVKQQEMIPLDIREPVYQSLESRYLAVFGMFATDIVFFGSLYYLYQLNTEQVIIAMMLLIFNDNIIARMRSIMEKISFPIIIIELLLIAQLIFQEIRLIVPIHIIIIILFSCKPYNMFYILQSKSISLSNQQLIGCISSIITGVLIF